MRLASLMSALVAAGGKRLDLGISWHPQIWVGRKRGSDRKRPGDGTRRQGKRSAEIAAYREGAAR